MGLVFCLSVYSKVKRDFSPSNLPCTSQAVKLYNPNSFGWGRAQPGSWDRGMDPSGVHRVPLPNLLHTQV